MKHKFWVALGEHCMFTKDDHYMFKVFYSGQAGDKGWGLTPKFIEADDIEAVRAKLHAFVDERINHMLNVNELDAMADKIKQKREEFQAKPKVPDSEVDSLSIGEFVGDKPQAKPESDGLLDLDTLI